jgi:hypothetical protein
VIISIGVERAAERLKPAATIAQDVGHDVDVVAVGGAAAALDAATGAAVDEHVLATFEKYVDRGHQPATLGLAIARVDVYVLGVQAVAAVVGVSVSVHRSAAMLAGEVLDPARESHYPIVSQCPDGCRRAPAAPPAWPAPPTGPATGEMYAVILMSNGFY